MIDFLTEFRASDYNCYPNDLAGSGGTVIVYYSNEEKDTITYYDDNLIGINDYCMKLMIFHC